MTTCIALQTEPRSASHTHTLRCFSKSGASSIVDSPNRYRFRVAIDGCAILISNGRTARVPDQREGESYDLAVGVFILCKSIENVLRLSVEERRKARASSVPLLEEGDSFSCTSCNNEYRRTSSTTEHKGTSSSSVPTKLTSEFPHTPQHHHQGPSKS